MTGVLARLRELFVAPVATGCAAASAGAAAVHVPSALVLGPPRSARSGAAALALALARRAGAPCALIAVWGDGEALGAGSSVPAMPAARRLATRLDARGFAARAAGRLVRVSLPGPVAEAASAALRLQGSAPVPAVAVLAGSLEPGFDPLLDAQDAVVVAAPAGAPDALLRLALDDLGRRRPAAVLSVPNEGSVAWALAAAGVALPWRVRHACAAALGALA